MSLNPIFTAPGIVQIHILFAAVAMIAGPIALFRNVRDRWHKRMGYTWVVAMAGLALSGLAIPSHNPVILHMGPIHTLCFFALHGIWSGVRHARAGRILAHRMSMRSLWFGAMGVAGLLTFLPGRTFNRALFGESSDAGWIIIVLGVILLWTVWRRQESAVSTIS